MGCVVRFRGCEIICFLAIVTASRDCCGVQASFSNVFDRDGHEIYVQGAESLNANNWTGTFAGLSPNSGSNYLNSANGNVAHDFVGLGLTKVLGGSISDKSYRVSFFIGKYQDIPNKPLNGVPFSDFSELRIGGAGGSMIWTQTPTPTQNGVWVEWKGIYTPSPADVGTPFRFTAVWTERALSSIGIDGPMVAAPVPEPSSIALGATTLLLVGRVVNRRRALSSEAH